MWLGEIFAIDICAYAVMSNHVLWCCISMCSKAGNGQQKTL
ncbi:hypothetical Protein YC6258_03718 [Gynuella sunshinyii YC6258]|uniref:Uncharacterized protein n=1 Tax=Gynuella sunshinyii YC6258 TaxID=1445510 RepID=A0A0C5VZC9_9GAMM|nr:hypothetical Protein YC6258_03718 [Gynuella sunshinyii YC6258]